MTLCLFSNSNFAKWKPINPDEPVMRIFINNF